MSKKSQVKDLTGQRFGKLVVIRLDHIDEKSQSWWKCFCDCDADQESRKIVVKKGKYLKDGSTSSCGCKRNEHLNSARKNVEHHATKEERSKSFYKQLRNIWRTLINRCHNKDYKGYNNYGAKGIYVCDDWRNDFWCFYNWAIENGYTDGMSLDRIDETLNYRSDNCEWIPIFFLRFSKRAEPLTQIKNNKI